MDITREKLTCKVCGWEWWKRLGGPDPKRCVRATCRSLAWKTGVPGKPGRPPTKPDEQKPAEPDDRRYVPLEETDE